MSTGSLIVASSLAIEQTKKEQRATNAQTLASNAIYRSPL
jgi:hypothetical protein